ncbi:MAG TPA: hypothetical protein DCP11_02505 [Microbacteriaceae bacterium]|nr:hypothetical protein [Microbacteriaceae bacterium]
MDAVATLDEPERVALEGQALPVAQAVSTAKFDRRLRVLREGLAPESIVARHVRAVADRRVDCAPAQDGMAWLSAYLPVAEAAAIHHRVTEAAISLRASGDPRAP